MVKTWGSQHSRNGVNVVISLCTTYGRLHLSCHSNWPRHIATNGGRGRSIGPWLLATIMGWSNIFIASSFVYQLIRDFKDFKTLDFQCACFHKEVMIKSQINTYTQNQHQIRTQNQKKKVYETHTFWGFKTLQWSSMLVLGHILILDMLTLWPHDVVHTIWTSILKMCALVKKNEVKKTWVVVLYFTLLFLLKSKIQTKRKS